MPSRPWSKVGADIFELGPQQFLIMVDYWSSYLGLQELKRVTSESVIRVLKVQFARRGILDVLVTDNGTQFSSSEFARFSEKWRFQLDFKTSSPRYPQSNGKADNEVKSLQSVAEESTSRQQRSSASILRLEKHPDRRSRNLTGSTFDGQKNTNAVGSSHQTAGTKSRQPDRRQAGKAKSHPRAAVQQEKSTANTITARSSYQDETPW